MLKELKRAFFPSSIWEDHKISPQTVDSNYYQLKDAKGDTNINTNTLALQILLNYSQRDL